MAISMLKIRRPLGRLIFNMGIAIPGKTVFLIETAPRTSVRAVMEVPLKCGLVYMTLIIHFSTIVNPVGGFQWYVSHYKTLFNQNPYLGWMHFIEMESHSYNALPWMDLIKGYVYFDTMLLTHIQLTTLLVFRAYGPVCKRALAQNL